MTAKQAIVVDANNAGLVTIEYPKDVTPSIYEMVFCHTVIDGRPVKLPGEVIEISGQHSVVQMFEGAEGLSIGTTVELTGKPFMVEVAPGMPGVRMNGLGSCLDSPKQDHLPRGTFFSPLTNLRANFEPHIDVGAQVASGTVLGKAFTGGLTYTISVPPSDKTGQVIEISNGGEMTVTDTIAKIKWSDGKVESLDMVQRYPVRKPRPVRNYQRSITPLFTGKRAVDASMILLKGGKLIVIGGAGTGKTFFTQDLAKHSEVDVVVLVLCGERSGEATEVVKSYQRMGLMDRTVLVLNTSARSAQARGQSVRFGLGVAEGMRDMGLDVLVIVDSLSRQGQGDRETSGVQGKMPGRQSFPVDLNSVLAKTFDRCGRVTCLNGQEASITAVMAVSPDGDDYENDAIAVAARQYADGCIILTNEVARRGNFPAVDVRPGLSNTKTTSPAKRGDLAAFFTEQELPDWIDMAEKITDLIGQSEGPLTEQIEVLTPRRMSTQDYRNYLLGSMLRRIFLKQDTFDTVDQKTVAKRLHAMMKFCIQLIEVFPVIENKDQASQFADQIGSRGFEITRLDTGYVQAYEELLREISEYDNQPKEAEEVLHAAV